LRVNSKDAVPQSVVEAIEALADEPNLENVIDCSPIFDQRNTDIVLRFFRPAADGRHHAQIRYRGDDRLVPVDTLRQRLRGRVQAMQWKTSDEPVE
jgi:hypothetical protein